MLYYRTHASRNELQPPELRRWRASRTDRSICQREVDGWRVVGIADPMFYDVPSGLRWEDIGEGWQAALDADGVDLEAHRLTVSTWPSETIEVPDVGRVTCPKVIDRSGARLFHVKFGRGFQEVLTPEQAEAEAKAKAIQAASKSGCWPEMGEQARTAA